MNGKPDDGSIEDALRREGAAWRARTPASDSTCVDPEMLAAWAERSLPAQQALEVEAHVSNCARCQEMAAIFALTEPPAPAAEPGMTPWLKRWWLPLAGGLSAAAILTFVFVATRRTDIVPTEEMTRTATAPAPTAPAPPPEPEAVVPTAPPPAGAPPPAEPAGKPGAPAETKPTAVTPPAPAAVMAPPVIAPTPPAQAPPPAAAPPPLPPPTAAPPPAAQATQQITVSAAPPVIDTKKTSTGGTFTKDVLDKIPSARDPWQIINMSGADPNTVVIMTGGSGATGGLNVGGSGSGRQVGVAGRGGRSSLPALPAAAWRVVSPTAVDWQLASQATPTTLTIESPTTTRIVGGASPSERVCWLVAADAVWRTTDADVFRRVSAPAGVIITGITADDAMHARITGSDGRHYATSDGGTTWTPET